MFVVGNYLEFAYYSNVQKFINILTVLSLVWFSIAISANYAPSLNFLVSENVEEELGHEDILKKLLFEEKVSLPKAEFSHIETFALHTNFKIQHFVKDIFKPPLV